MWSRRGRGRSPARLTTPEPLTLSVVLTETATRRTLAVGAGSRRDPRAAERDRARAALRGGCASEHVRQLHREDNPGTAPHHRYQHGEAVQCQSALPYDGRVGSTRGIRGQVPPGPVAVPSWPTAPPLHQHGPTTGHKARPGCGIDDLGLPRAALTTLVLAHREPAWVDGTSGRGDYRVGL
jgi:hypothetical protein